MVIRALKQTNNHSKEAAIEYISKMSYQDPVREQMVSAAARPVAAGMKGPGRHLSPGTGFHPPLPRSLLDTFYCGRI